MSEDQPNNPLHGLTLQAILEALLERHGWPELAVRIPIRCFATDPSVGSSLKFLRNTPWARAKVERLYVDDLRRLERKREQNLRRKQRRAMKNDPAPGLAANAEPDPGEPDTG